MSDGCLSRKCDVLVVGGGAAGIAAATELAAAGFAVELVEQGERLGGAIHRQPASAGAASYASRATRRQWRRLSGALAGSSVRINTRCVFLGVDSDGLALVEDRCASGLVVLPARVVVLAVGAVERVRPRPGWELAGVTTAGGMQVGLKETGRPPEGRILIAGNGPLTIALAAQLARHGNPPVAVLETADPLGHALSGLPLAAHPRIVLEAFGYLGTLARASVPWRRATALVAVDQEGDGLVATVVDRAGRAERIPADHIALHDGIRPNAFGLPRVRDASDAAPFIVHAGDCREALGAASAEADGRRAARLAAAWLRRETATVAALETAIGCERAAQNVLSRLFAPVNAANRPERWDDEALLCRCEQKTVGDLHRLLSRMDALSPREIKLNGRFCMGSCQGRFCADNVVELIAAARPGVPAPATVELTGSRWPIRPVSIAAMASWHARETQSQDEQK